MPGILGKKLGMTRIQQDDGRMIPITVVQCEPNTVTQLKTTEKDGYLAMVLGFSEFSKMHKTRPFRFMREFKINEEEKEKLKKGDTVSLEAFQEIQAVTIVGTSRGKGTQGTVKRHNFSRGPMGHGSHHKREPGSVGTRAKPGRIQKGKRMAGRMGNDTITKKNVSVAYLDTTKHLIGLKGSVPGAKGSLVIIKA